MTGKEKRKEKKKKIMSLIVATNVVASRPPEGRPIGTALRAKSLLLVCAEFRNVGSWDPFPEEIICK